MIKDSHGRIINYLRLAVTDRCNLRCTYCMPASGLNWLNRQELMTTQEMLRICSLFVRMGIDKIRITGGEPFVRKDLMPFLQELSRLPELKELTITTNGLLTEPLIPDLKKLGVRSVNLSLDSLDKDRFLTITRRDGLDKVLSTLDALLANDFEVKVNTVVMEGQNIEDIVPLVKLTESLPISVRFIEEMPFNGGGNETVLTWDYLRIIEHITKRFPLLSKLKDGPHSTSLNYQVPGHKGTVGVIPAFTRSFCGSCNRLRLTSNGGLRTCLYSPGTFNLKDVVRRGGSDNELEFLLTQAILNKPIDGWYAQKELVENKLEHQSMATIGG